MNWTDPKTNEKSSGYRENGYFPEAFINMLALLGWNPGDEREIMTLDEMSNAFSLEHVSKSGAKFDPVKARWFNHQYLMKCPTDTLGTAFKILLSAEYNINTDTSTAATIAGLLRDRVDFIKDLPAAGIYFFKEPTGYNEQDLKKHSTSESAAWLASLITTFSAISWETAHIDETISAFIEEHGLPAGKVYNMLRIGVVGSSSGPHLTDILFMIGQTETLHRISNLVSHLGNAQKEQQ